MNPDDFHDLTPEDRVNINEAIKAGKSFAVVTLTDGDGKSYKAFAMTEEDDPFAKLSHALIKGLTEDAEEGR